MNLRFKKSPRVNIKKADINPFLSKKLHKLKHGNYGLKLLNDKILTYKQLNGIRLAFVRKLRKSGVRFFKIYFRIYFVISLTRKPNLSRMGKGVGSIYSWVGLGKTGSIFIEINVLVLSITVKESYQNPVFFYQLNIVLLLEI